DKLVTGVQTCALPISGFGGGVPGITRVDRVGGPAELQEPDLLVAVAVGGHDVVELLGATEVEGGVVESLGGAGRGVDAGALDVEIGRASCRERGWSTG